MHEERISLFFQDHEHVAKARALARSGKITVEDYLGLLQHYACLVDISDKLVHISDAIQNKLLTAQQALKKATEAKSAFVAGMSHELRTPLNGILGLTDLLKESGLQEMQREWVEDILSSGHLLLDLINEALDLAKIEAGKMDVEVRPFDLHEMVASVIRLMKPRAEESGLHLAAEVDSAVPIRVRADAGRIRQILLNLLSNAVKFTPAGEVRLTVGARPSGPEAIHLIFHVRDTGIGIPAERQKQLFEPFSQADESTSRIFGGTGLGLSICKRLAGLMGGKMGLSSEEGHGSDFWFTVLVAEDHSVDEPRKTDTCAEHGSLDEAPHSGAFRLLVAEDNAVNQKVISLLLKRLGYAHDLVGDGEEALAKLGLDAAGKRMPDGCPVPYDLLLLDVQMPKVDGLTVADFVRADEASGGCSAIPIVAMTAHAGDEFIALCRRHGLNDYVAKPINREKLASAIRRGLRQPGAATP
ncbi:MAG: ATP-binding protein [Kiritimatiellae bacterium]|nr:ATP-binding protein [Kiritimatiellia bacterium]